MGAKSVVLLAAFVTATVPARAAQPQLPRIHVVLENDRVVPSEMVARSQAEVTRLYRLIDVELVWLAEPVAAETSTYFVKLTDWEPREDEYPAALGLTPTPKGKRSVRAYVFWGRIQRSAMRFTAGFDAILAIAIAHEIGHMVLPARAHSKAGLMHASWDSNHFRSAAAGLLHFSPESATSIRRALAPQLAIKSR